MRVDFSKVVVHVDLEGNTQEVDLRKNMGNLVWRETSDIAVSDLGRNIYASKGMMDVPDEMAPEIVSIVGRSMLIVPVKNAIGELLSSKTEK